MAARMMQCDCISGIRSLLRGSSSPTSRSQFSPTIARVRYASQRSVSQSYEVRQTLGSGSFGVVSLAVSKQCGRECVLKVVDRAVLEDCAALDLEVSLHAEMDHPHIVRIYESFVTSARMSILMEWCQGGELCTALEDQGCFSECDSYFLFTQVMRAVRYMHGKEVVHRDLKLENFLLQKKDVPLDQNVVKLIDFGFARRFTPGTCELSTICGSPGYAAPEVWLGSKYDESCDIFSCGVILFCMLAGRMPFDGETSSEIIRATTRHPLVFEAEECCDLSVESRRLVARMCAKSPCKRPSAKDVLSSSVVQESSDDEADRPHHFPSKLLRSMSNFGKLDSLAQASLCRVAYHLDDALVEDMRKVFNQIDSDNDGMISLDEMRQAEGSIGKYDFARVEDLFRNADYDGSGAIEYTEFLAATLGSARLPESACKAAFRSLDPDLDGQIRVGELQEAIKSPGYTSDGQELHHLISRADSNCDGAICYDEFVAILNAKDGRQNGFIGGPKLADADGLLGGA